LDTAMVKQKVADYQTQDYANLVEEALSRLPNIIFSPEFQGQMRRFIDAETIERTLAQQPFLTYLTEAVSGVFKEMTQSFVPMQMNQFTFKM
jgi:hypothetical protein